MEEVDLEEVQEVDLAVAPEEALEEAVAVPEEALVEAVAVPEVAVVVPEVVVVVPEVAVEVPEVVPEVVPKLSSSHIVTQVSSLPEVRKIC